jgi:hypothetical protein
MNTFALFPAETGYASSLPSGALDPLLKRPADKTDLKGTDLPEKSAQKLLFFYGFSRFSGILTARLILLTY